MTADVKTWIFDWYPIFGVFFMFGLLTVFVLLLRSTMRSTKPETIKASRTAPVLWDEVQGVDSAKAELLDVTAWLKEPKRFAALGAKPPRGVLLFGPPGTGQDDARPRRRRPGRGRLLRGLGLELRRDVRRPAVLPASAACSSRPARPAAR